MIPYHSACLSFLLGLGFILVARVGLGVGLWAFVLAIGVDEGWVCVILIVDSFEVALVTMIVSGIELVFVAFIVVYRGLALQSVGDLDRCW